MPRLRSLLPCSLLLAACGSHGNQSDAPSFPTQALESVATSSGLSVEVRTSPDQPPTHGVLSAQLTLKDASGAIATGLAVAVTPWMPAMGHGTSTAPAVTETEPGVFLVDPIGAYMPGTWQLRTDISGSVEDHVDLSLELQ